MFQPYLLPHDEALKARRDEEIASLPRETQLRAFDLLESVLTPEDAEQLRTWFRYTGWDWVERNYIGETWGRQIVNALSRQYEGPLLPEGKTWDDYYVQVLEIVVGIRPDFRDEPVEE